MWAAHMPYYSEYNSSRRKGIDAVTSPVSVTGSLDDPDGQHVTDLLEPAVDGPPSPQRLRQLSKQMKRASHLQRPRGHHHAQSASSSIRSTTAEQPAWELALENMTLTRRSSARSTNSSTSRDRPESMAWGKAMFHRRGKSNRESTSHSSSGSSMYSTEGPGDSISGGIRDTLMPTLFARRKPTRDEAAQRRLQISGPFNFQHVAHTQRDTVPIAQRAHGRMDLSDEFLDIPTPGPTSAPAFVRDDDHTDMAFSNSSAEALGAIHSTHLELPEARPALLPRHTAPASGPRRLVKQVRSQDQLRTSPPRQAPPRPPRSPIAPTSSSPSPPSPPPRVSSRVSLSPGIRDAQPVSRLDRPQTSSGFRRPEPFSPLDSLQEPPTPPATSHGFTTVAAKESYAGNERRLSSLHSVPNDPSWPLSVPLSAAYESPLPDVPEEEEHHGVSRRSRLSLASNNSSLRGSQSVPMLRSLANSQRPMSGASDTLGRFESLSASRAMRPTDFEGSATVDEDPLRADWEDVIDYCYEHEVEADCDYRWERSSLDASRANSPAATFLDELTEATSTPASGFHRPRASHSDFLPLSPESHGSPHLTNEATSPASAMSASSNFSFPRGDKASRLSHLKATRPLSGSSSFQESQCFHLSPSLLIPGDYHQQMLMSEAERHEHPDNRELMGISSQHSGLEGREHAPGASSSPLLYQLRSSTSTTESASTQRTDSTEGRHISATSTWTVLTRTTASSTSLNKMANIVAEEAEPVPTTLLVDSTRTDSDDEGTPPATKDSVPELIPFPSVPIGRKAYHKSHASESLVREEVPLARTSEAIRARRPRARTTSVSAQAPPVGQYALFPRGQIRGTGDRI